MKKKLTIPVVVTRNGSIRAGYSVVDADAQETTESGTEFAIDCMSDEEYKSGYRVVHVAVDIDIDKVFEDFNLEGKVQDGEHVSDADV